MALFTDLESDRPPRPRRRLVGRIILVAAIVGLVVVALAPAPFVIEQPGPVYNVLGDVTVSGKQVPLIDIPSAKTFDTSGTLDMLTVSLVGDPGNLPNWLDIASAILDPSRAVVPIKEIYPPGYSVQDSNQQGAVDMQNSQQDAIAAALTELGYTFSSTLTVASTEASGPAATSLKANDVIVSVNGKTFTNVTDLRAEIAANGTGKPADVVVERAGAQLTYQITPVQSAGANSAPILGIVAGNKYDFPIDVTIQLQNVGGPSAGQMFALGIIDKLTPGALNGGKSIAGTGTITAAGQVGPIGGIRQKMFGARGSGATFFLAPQSNCDEVTGHIPSGLTVFAVSTLGDSLAALKEISAGADTANLPTCPAS